MNPRTIIFTGRSGCGKGTQAALVEKILNEKSPDTAVVHLETGKLFREFIQGKNYTHEISRKIYHAGGLQPEFLTVHLWSDFFVEKMSSKAHLIIDGTPRKLNEAEILHSALTFYNRIKPAVVLLNVSRKWSEDRMLERKRADDNRRDIEARLDWFDAEVMPAIDFLKKNPFYDFYEVDGERTIAEIHDDIAGRLNID